MSAAVYCLAEMGSDVPPGNAWLSDGEIAVLDKLRIPKRRADWRLGRWTAKRAVASRLGLGVQPGELRGVEIWPAPSGAPQAFVVGEPAGVAVSLSHCREVGFCAVAAAGVELGCDIEVAVPHSSAFREDYFTPGERRIVGRAPAAGQFAVLTLLWSAKESTLKALQSGLRCDPRSVLAVPAGLPAPGMPTWRPLTTRDAAGRIFHGWWRETGGLLWTVVADPPPLQPAVLRCDA